MISFASARSSGVISLYKLILFNLTKFIERSEVYNIWLPRFGIRKLMYMAKNVKIINKCKLRKVIYRCAKAMNEP